jgi:hypothetical protein
MGFGWIKYKTAMLSVDMDDHISHTGCYGSMAYTANSDEGSHVSKTALLLALVRNKGAPWSVGAWEGAVGLICVTPLYSFDQYLPLKF